MKLSLLFVLSSFLVFGQQDGLNSIDRYTEKIDEQIERGELSEFWFPERSRCGGSLYGHYENGKLRAIKASLGVGFYQDYRTVYFDTNENILKYQFEMHWPLEEEFSEHLDFDNPDSINWDLMEYADTTWTYYFDDEIRANIYSGDELVNQSLDQDLFDSRMTCVDTMVSELDRWRVKE